MLRDVNASTDTADDRASVCTTSAPVQWWNHLPDLVSASVRLRELRAGDAAALIPAIASPEVGKYLSPGPTSVAEIEMFITWARRARSEARYICFGVVPHGATDPVGVFQLWPLEPSFRTAEWGFALDPAYWGTGLFHQCAQLVMEFGFDQLGMFRLEARAAAENARGNRALEKLGGGRCPRGCCAKRSWPVASIVTMRCGPSWPMTGGTNKWVARWWQERWHERTVTVSTRSALRVWGYRHWRWARAQLDAAAGH